MTREGRPGLRRKQPELTNGSSPTKQKKTVPTTPTESVWIDVSAPRKSLTPRRRRFLRRPISKRIVSNSSRSSSTSTTSDHDLQIPGTPSRPPEATPYSRRDILLDLNNLDDYLSHDSLLPTFPNVTITHDNWILWRIYSAEIHSTLEKHLHKFKGNYLSRTLLGELFYQSINDFPVDYDDTLEFHAAQIVKIHDPFMDRLTMDAFEVTTVDNKHVLQTEKKRKVFAVGSLAELLNAVLRERDYIVIFGKALVDSETIALNPRYTHEELVLIAVYRHDGIFTPEFEGNSDSVIIGFDSNKFLHELSRCGDREMVMRIKPRNISAGSVLPTNIDARQETSTDKVRRYLDNHVSSPKKNNCNGSVPSPHSSGRQRVSKTNTPVAKVVLNESRRSRRCSSIGDFHNDVIRCFDSTSSSSTNLDDEPKVPTLTNSQTVQKVNEENHNKEKEMNSRDKEKRNEKTLNSSPRMTSPSFHLPQQEEEPIERTDQDLENVSVVSSTDRMMSIILAEIEQDIEKSKTLEQEKGDENCNNTDHIQPAVSSSARLSSRSGSREHNNSNKSCNKMRSISGDLSNPYASMNSETQIHNLEISDEEDNAVSILQEEAIKVEPASPVTDLQDECEEEVMPMRNYEKEFQLKRCCVLVERLVIKGTAATTPLAKERNFRKTKQKSESNKEKLPAKISVDKKKSKKKKENHHVSIGKDSIECLTSPSFEKESVSHSPVSTPKAKSTTPSKYNLRNLGSPLTSPRGAQTQKICKGKERDSLMKERVAVRRSCRKKL